MMKWKAILEDYFKFSRKERLAVLIICILIIVIFLIPPPAPSASADKSMKDDTTWISALKRIEQPTTRKGWESDSIDSPSPYERSPGDQDRFRRPPPTLFLFDPNTASEPDWEKLGLRPRTITTIRRFLDRGGHFRRPEDLGKIYGLHADEFERLKPFVRIPVKDDETRSEKKYEQAERVDRVFTRRESIPIDINQADSVAWQSLPSIGNKLASRILRFREKLGGFYAIEQVGETFGLADSVFQRIRTMLLLGSPNLKKISINTASIEELGAHPYIRFALGKTIIDYRKQHGSFDKLEDVKNIVSITPELFKKLEPYLQLQ